MLYAYVGFFLSAWSILLFQRGVASGVASEERLDEAKPRRSARTSHRTRRATCSHPLVERMVESTTPPSRFSSSSNSKTRSHAAKMAVDPRTLSRLSPPEPFRAW